DNGRGYNQVDRLVFGEGIELADISLRKEGSNMVVVVADANNGEDSQIVIQGALANSAYRIEEMVFHTGLTVTGDWIENLAREKLGQESHFELLTQSIASFGNDEDSSNVVNTKLIAEIVAIDSSM
ncbi:hypothetical protein MHM93_03175, partial [Pseudoalteromonas sp. MM17-2]|uniref:hypothetical protein n=1 Tax=Pseudoalteromonas sp. MM17-2 TaxID=2917753 RepID=UPI001EF45D3A